MTSSTSPAEAGRTGTSDRCRRRRRRRRPASLRPRRRAPDQLAARSASRGPCRAARCPSLRRQRSRATTDGAETRASRPSRSRRRATDRSRHADRDDVRCREGDAVPLRGAPRAAPRRGIAQRDTAPACRRQAGSEKASVGIAPQRSRAPARRRQRRSRPDSSPSSASCTPFAPSSRFHRNGPPSTTWRRNSSHSTLNALS